MGQIKTVTYLYSLCVVGGLIAVWYVNYLPIYIASLIGMFLLAFLLIKLVRKLYPLNGTSHSAPETTEATPENQLT
jgi:hypothetical protein